MAIEWWPSSPGIGVFSGLSIRADSHWPEDPHIRTVLFPLSWLLGRGLRHVWSRVQLSEHTATLSYPRSIDWAH